MHQASWYENLPATWVIEVSDNSWTTDQLGLIWLKEMFNKQTQAHTVGRYQLLILNDYRSHATAEFNQFCMQNSIIALYILSHFSYLLQLLDISCFSSLKRVYSQQIETSIRLNINYINKNEFLVIYEGAWTEALKDTSIRNRFKVTDLVLYNLDEVLICLHASTSPLSIAHGSQSFWTPKTSHNVTQLDCQISKIKQYI